MGSTTSIAKKTVMKKKTSQLINWDFLSNSSIADVYRRFASGTSSVKEVQAELKNTEHITLFNRLIRRGGVDKARESARSALRRRGIS